MPSDLHSKVALITGAGQGVGQGIALAMSSSGASIAVVGRTESKLLDTCKLIEGRGGTAAPIVCDVSDANDVENCVRQVVETFGRLDILVNNAQSFRVLPLLDLADDDFMEAWLSGPLAAVRFMRIAHPHLKATRGVIFNMGSGIEFDDYEIKGYGPYATAKSAMTMITRVAAVEWGKDGIRALVVRPGAWTPLVRQSQARDPERMARILARMPLGDLGDAEMDVGRGMAWLASDEASQITNSSIHIGGGGRFNR